MDLAPRYKLLTLLRLFKLLTLFTLLILATLFTLLALFTLLTLLTMFALLTLLPPPTLLIYCINSVGAKKKNGSSSTIFTKLWSRCSIVACWHFISFSRFQETWFALLGNIGPMRTLWMVLTLNLTKFNCFCCHIFNFIATAISYIINKTV